MSGDLLQTKLHLPPLRSSRVVRPYLIEKLNQGLEQGGKLVLVSAPAGFGKTTIVREWLSHLEGDNIGGAKAAWLSLDEGDHDPVRFLTYFVASLNRLADEGRKIGETALDMLQSPQPVPPETVLPSLINDMVAVPATVVLVLDDYHVTDSPPVDAVLAFLLEHLPPQMHLVLITREDPHLPISRLRASGQLTELRAADLRFSSAETAEFLQHVMDLDLTTDEVSALESRTEGWIAGLHLAAISLQGSTDVPDSIRSFTGSHHFVLDYLIEEVLDQQSEDVQQFLLDTAVLNRLNGSLCDALTGQGNGRETLETLEHANMFIIPLDEERRWYRYHHLFADLLRQRLRRNQRERMPQFHLRASTWYEQHGFIDEAIKHALDGGDNGRAAYLSEMHADTLWRQGEHTKLRRWLAALPLELVTIKPILSIFHAWYLFAGGHRETAERVLLAAEEAIELGPESEPNTPREQPGQGSDCDRSALRGRLAAISAFMASYRGDVPGIIALARQALIHLPEQDLAWRSAAAITLGDAHGFQGDMTAAYQARLAAVTTCRAAGDIYYLMLANLKLAITLRAQGHLQQTIDLCRQQLQMAAEKGLAKTGAAGWCLAIWGEVLAERNDLDNALQRTQTGLKLVERSVDLAMLGWSYLCLVRVLFSRQEIDAATEIIQKIVRIAQESEFPPWIMSQTAVWQARLCLAQNQLEAAAGWVADLDLATVPQNEPLPRMDYFQLVEYIMLARVWIAQDRSRAAVDLLHRLLEQAETGGRKTRVIEILLLQAQAFRAEGDLAQALVALKRALSLAEPEGFVHIFVDEGSGLALLLIEARSQGVAPEYCSRLLTKFPSTEATKVMSSAIETRNATACEPLSERELEVLQLIAEGLTNPEIAGRLYLSLNTVKAHTRNIYGKLDAHSRTQAVAKARALAMIPV